MYDNGSSLCCYVNESQLADKDARRFEALVDSKSRSIIRIDGSVKTKPKHRDVAQYLIGKYPIAKTIAKRFLDRLTEDAIDKIMNQYPAEILDIKKNLLIRRYLLRKLDLLGALLNLEDNGSNAK